MNKGFFIIIFSLLLGMFFTLMNSEKNSRQINTMDRIDSWKIVK